MDPYILFLESIYIYKVLLVRLNLTPIMLYFCGKIFKALQVDTKIKCYAF